MFWKILSPGRLTETRLNSSQLSRSPSSNQSFDSLTPTPTSPPPDIKRGIFKEPSIRASLEEDSESNLNSSGVQYQVNIWKSKKKHSLVYRESR